MSPRWLRRPGTRYTIDSGGLLAENHARGSVDGVTPGGDHEHYILGIGKAPPSMPLPRAEPAHDLSVEVSLPRQATASRKPGGDTNFGVRSSRLRAKRAKSMTGDMPAQQYLGETWSRLAKLARRLPAGCVRTSAPRSSAIRSYGTISRSTATWPPWLSEAGLVVGKVQAQSLPRQPR